MKKKKLIKELLKNIPDAYVVIKEGYIDSYILKENGVKGMSTDAYLLHTLYAIANTDGRADHVKEMMLDWNNIYRIPGINKRRGLLSDIRYRPYFERRPIPTTTNGRPFMQYTLTDKGKKLLSLLK